MEPNGSPDLLVTLASASLTARYIWKMRFGSKIIIIFFRREWRCFLTDFKTPGNIVFVLVTNLYQIDLVWRRRSAAWQSRLLYAFIRYHGLGLSTFNIVAVVHSNWSVGFCRVYLYVTSLLGLTQMCAVQGVLVWRVYVMYHRSFRVLVSSMVLFASQFISMATLYTMDARHFVIAPVPAPITGCSVLGPISLGSKIYWCIALAFETYLCALVVPPAFSQWKSVGTGGVALLDILIRDSLIWYFCLVLCLLLNALSLITGKVILILVGLPATQAASTVGGPRLIINLRAAYFSSNRDRPSTFGGFPHDNTTDYMETKGTVGRFRPAPENEVVDGEDEDRRATSFGAGVRADEEVHDDRLGSPSLIALQRLPPKGKSRASSAPVSSYGELGDCEGPSGPGVGAGRSA